MEAIISAVVGEVVTRSVYFLINRYLRPASSKKESIRRRLQWMLMRIQVTVKEAEGRHITNQAMLQQLNMIREVMYQGYYMLDTSSVQHQEETWDHGASHSLLSRSKSNPAKRICFSSRGKNNELKEIEDVLSCVETAITGMSEFVVFLKNYTPMFRQPYSTYLFIGNCMFGRQAEMERVINFLLYEEHPVDGNIGVLPIVGPRKVGKTTLIEHVCRDERVRNHFSRIILLSDYNFREEMQCTFRDRARIKHQNDDSDGEKTLVIVEVDGNVDESAWRRLLLQYYSSYNVSTKSKIIVTSLSKDAINFGTTEALSLNFLSREAYWYFFKALLFGSADSEELPKLSSIAVTILDEYFHQGATFAGSFIDLNNLANLLKANVGVHSWRKILEFLRENRQQNECNLGMENEYRCFRRVTEATQYFVVDSHDRIGLDDEEAPNITVTEAISMSVVPSGKFEVLVWKSHLPPYHKYIYSCEIIEVEMKVTENKQSRKSKILR